MAYLDIFGVEAYGNFNRKLARLTNLTIAVYWSELLKVCSKVVQKQKFDENGFFKVDRKYITSQASISEEDQLFADEVLSKLEIINLSDDKNKISVNLEKLNQILVSEDAQKIVLPEKAPVVEPVKPSKADLKKQAQIDTMKKLILEKDPELYLKYLDWVESVFTSGRFLTRAKIRMFEDKINSFSPDKKSKAALLDIAILTGYDVADWVISRYTSKDSVGVIKSPATLGNTQEVATSIDQSIAF